MYVCVDLLRGEQIMFAIMYLVLSIRCEQTRPDKGSLFLV